MADPSWQPDQRVVLHERNDRRIVKIERVSKAGIAAIGERTFRKDGFERGGGVWSFGRIEPLTPALEAEIKAERADRAARYEMANLLEWGMRNRRDIPIDDVMDVVATLSAAKRRLEAPPSEGG